MKSRLLMLSIAIITVGCSFAAGKVYVDKHGIMRDSSTNCEVRYYGVNYTLPFAHAFRAMNRLGVNHHDAIDRDVYHISRMGANAFRLHLWDVELTDSIGNLIDNEHLELLDYLIESLEERGIDIILTAQTNFGNGYPERDEPTGGFSYLYEKCDVHSNPEAIQAQKKYLEGLVTHVNRYTGKSYADDNAIIAIEINNEPCHDTDELQVTDYINTMATTVRDNGWEKPILYNVSHNMPLAQGYYNADIDGTTYQWYPIGLVSGHSRKGNFLPYVDDYYIPYSRLQGYGSKAKIIYEFDPADMPDSYLYPAVARTFARNGFQWATQFAYDPIDMAQYNTEYQTHYLNLVYTPQKALGMKIAAKVMETVPSGADYGKYPVDTVFGSATVSYKRNLAIWNTPHEFYYTNSLSDSPIAVDSLRYIAGYGNSPVVEYPGRGAYFIDKIAPGIWRLEIMPDVLFLSDPFEKPSLDREVGVTINATHPITINLPDLPANYCYTSVAEGNPFGGEAKESTIHVQPGVYLISKDEATLCSINHTDKFDHILINEYVAPTAPKNIPLHVNHSPELSHREGEDLVITAEAFGDPMPTSLIIYPDDISFWKKENRLYTMRQTEPYTYSTTIPAEDLKGKSSFRYKITAENENESRTFPANTPGNPLDWDSVEGEYYTTKILETDAPVILLSGLDSRNLPDVSTIPDEWDRSNIERRDNEPFDLAVINIRTRNGIDSVKTVLTKYVGDITKSLYQNINSCKPGKLKLRTRSMDGIDKMTIGLINSDGITFAKEVNALPDTIIEIPLTEMFLSPTLLCPAPFPTFLKREFIPERYDQPLYPQEIEKLQISFSGNESEIEIVGAWLE